MQDQQTNHGDGSFHIEGSFRAWPQRPLLTSVNAMVFFAAVGNVLLPFVLALGYRMVPSYMVSAIAALGMTLYYYLAMFRPVWRYAEEHQGAAEGMRLKRPSAVGVLIAALLSVAGVMLASDIGTLWAIVIESMGGRLSSGGSSLAAMPLPVQILVGAVVPGICEEWLFRGAVLSAWERYGTRRAVLVSSLLFVGMHGNVQALPAHIICAVVLGVLVVATDSVYTGIVYHVLYNSLIILFSTSGTGGAGTPVIELIGGAPVVVMMVQRAVIMGGVMAGMLFAAWSLGKKRTRPQAAPDANQPLPAWSIVVLSASVVTALCMYAVDLLSIMGVLT